MNLQAAMEAELACSGAAALDMMRCQEPEDREVLLSAWKTAGVLQECNGEDAEGETANLLRLHVLDAGKALGHRYEVWKWIQPVYWSDDPEEQEEQVYQFLAMSGVAQTIQGYRTCFHQQWEAWIENGIQKGKLKPLSLYEATSNLSLQKLISTLIKALKLPEEHPFVTPILKPQLKQLSFLEPA